MQRAGRSMRRVPTPSPPDASAPRSYARACARRFERDLAKLVPAARAAVQAVLAGEDPCDRRIDIYVTWSFEHAPGTPDFASSAKYYAKETFAAETLAKGALPWLDAIGRGWLAVGAPAGAPSGSRLVIALDLTKNKSGDVTLGTGHYPSLAIGVELDAVVPAGKGRTEVKEHATLPTRELGSLNKGVRVVKGNEADTVAKVMIEQLGVSVPSALTIQ